MKTTFLLSHAAAGLVLAAGLTLGSDDALACNGSSPYLGEVCPVAFNWCPVGTLPADGRTLTVSGNEALFTLLGTTFGGNGTTTFGLPNLNNASVVGSNPAASPSGLGVASGQNSVALTAANLPAHTHAATLTVNLATTPALAAKQARGNDTLPQAGDALATAITQVGPSVNPVSSYIPAASAGSTVGLGGAVTGFSGTGQVTVANTGVPVSINTIPPQLALTYCIATTGIFPQRPN